MPCHARPTGSGAEVLSAPRFRFQNRLVIEGRPTYEDSRAPTVGSESVTVTRHAECSMDLTGSILILGVTRYRTPRHLSVAVLHATQRAPSAPSLYIGIASLYCPRIISDKYQILNTRRKTPMSRSGYTTPLSMRMQTQAKRDNAINHVVLSAVGASAIRVVLLSLSSLSSPLARLLTGQTSSFSSGTCFPSRACPPALADTSAHCPCRRRSAAGGCSWG